MTAATLAPSAYPAAVEALIPPARKLAEQLGEVPSRNRLMKEFKVGAPKAIALREALTNETMTDPEVTPTELPSSDLQTAPAPTEPYTAIDPRPVPVQVTEIAQLDPGRTPGHEDHHGRPRA